MLFSLRKEVVLSQATTRLSLEDTLHDPGQTQKEERCVVPLR